jgi:murein DD-endopeptidase MepM/ murein hydrolase activator NlpD
MVIDSTGRSEAVVALSLANRLDRRVRIDDLRIAYVDDGATLSTETVGRSFFTDPVFDRPRKIEPGQSLSWRAICLLPPVGADAVRFELDLVGRSGGRRARVSRVFDLPLGTAPPTIRLQLPFEGYWKVTQGHSCTTNHRTGALGGEFAWDFAALRQHSGAPDDGEVAFTSGAPVLSPVEGTIARVVDGVPDNEGLTTYPRRSMVDDLRRPEWVYGNFVMIEADPSTSSGFEPGAWVVLAHLQNGSIAVRDGERVRAGQFVGRVGNSGNSIEPHLHLHVMSGSDFADSETRGVPAVLENFRLYTAANADGGGSLHATRVAAGDPPEGSVVTPVTDRE